jgi:hypothetical protein
MEDKPVTLNRNMYRDLTVCYGSRETMPLLYPFRAFQREAEK